MPEAQIIEATQRAEAAIRELAGRFLPHASLILYGSRARGDARRRSDFDLAVRPGPGFEDRELLLFSEALERSPEIIYEIDLVDLDAVSPQMRRNIEAEGVIWKN